MVTIRQPLPPQVSDALMAYANLLRKWNATINLVSAADLAVLWPRHIEDSLQLGGVAGPRCRLRRSISARAQVSLG